MSRAEAQQAAKPSQATVAIKDVTVIDVRDGSQTPHQTVLVEGTRVVAVGAVRKVKVPASARVVRGTGRYLIPGLWDMHSHVQTDCNQDIAYPLLIANGVTGIRELNVGSLEQALQRRREVAAGNRVGPRSVISGPALDNMSGGPDCQGLPTHLAVASPERARQIVDSLKAAGADLLKVYEGPSREVLFAIAAEARRIGIPFGGHIPIGGAVSAAEASDSGWRSIEHVRRSAQFCQQPDQCAELAARFKRNKTWVTPTMAVVALMDGVFPPRPDRLRYSSSVPDSDETETSSPGVGDSIPPWIDSDTAGMGSDWAVERRQTHLLWEAGVSMLAGSDGMKRKFFARLAPGFSLHDELRLLVKAGGLTPLGALQAATLNPALFLAAADSIGGIGPGQLADLVVLDADPLAAIENTTRIHAVVANGRLFDRPALDSLLDDAARSADAERAAGRRKAAEP